MLCTKDSWATLFFNCPISFHVLCFFYEFFSILLGKLLSILSSNSNYHSGDNDGYQAVTLGDLWFFTDDFLPKGDDFVPDIIYNGEALLFTPKQITKTTKVRFSDTVITHEAPLYEDADDTEEFTTDSPEASDSGNDEEQSMEDEERSLDDDESFNTPPTETDSVEDGEFDSQTQIVHNGVDGSEEECGTKEDTNSERIRSSISEHENFFVLEEKKDQFEEKSERELIGDLFTDGSTSKDSSEWRSSSIYRDSGTEDPFSSSSRRSCAGWESYTLYRKYDEEMLFFDRYSTQKLSEAENLRSIQVRPRSVSERIVHKITALNSRSSSKFQYNPYEELEISYIAQICLAWEALNWNYKNFKRFKASSLDENPRCSGQIAQQFQQFQVLLQRFIENEPYEHGRRPEVYARMRKYAPNLLQVPEFIDSEEDNKKVGPNAMISSTEFLRIMEDGIRTFMNFLKADKQTHCQMFTDLFKRNRRLRVDPILLHFMKKTNIKKKRKIKDIYRAGKCFRKKKMKEEDEMEILMGLIDLKVVSRVLKMSTIRDEQLSWCEEKMSKVKVLEGKVQRDSSSPLFFPAH
ncbi:hypothetical protein ACHQM5_005694 [Ranunculus cassubicifolius]